VPEVVSVDTETTVVPAAMPLVAVTASPTVTSAASLNEIDRLDVVGQLTELITRVLSTTVDES
jgi:hypothetical protein